MEKSDNNQKKRIIFNFLYASLIGVMVVACAASIAFVSSRAKQTTTGGIVYVGNENVAVSVVTFVTPLQDATIVKDYSATELQFNDTLKQWEIHKAIDFVAGNNTNVYAVSNGTVSNIFNNYLEGTVVEITHSNGLVSVYKSLENATVAIGDQVNAGQVIGNVGSSMAQEQNVGAHLHFEMLENGKKVNPHNYLDLGSK